MEPDHLLGNIHEIPMADLVASPWQLELGQDKLDAFPGYRLECPVRFAWRVSEGPVPRDPRMASPA